MYPWIQRFQDQHPNDYIAEPHKLCKHCQTLCESSQLLRDVPRDCLETVLRPENEGDPGLNDVTESHLHATYAELESSYLQGCHLCSLIYDLLANMLALGDTSLNVLHDNSGASNVRLEIEVVVRKGAKECDLRMGVFDELKGSEDSGVSLKVFAANDRRLRPVENAYPGQLVISTDSSASVNLARHWLSQCRSQHAACRLFQFSNVDWMPSRLIDVGLEGDTMSPRLYVVEGDGWSGAQVTWRPYLTLSHRWGTADVTKLMSENLADMQRALPMDSLPRTFQDAIQMTRALGYRYLWIDSLCIIQDSADDWQREASHMASVYGNSDCTLAVLDSSGSEGCFRRRNPLFRRPCRLVQSYDTSIYAYGFELSTESPVGGEDDRQDFVLDNMPLLRRAWVLQERLISPRVLYLGCPGLYWECCKTKLSEFWPNGAPHGNRFQENAAVKEDLTSVLRSNASENKEPENFAGIWNWVTETYTSAGLTFRTDRAVALSGVASLIQQRTGMTYLAGLWKESLPEGLLWSCVMPTDLSISDRRSPTWAWLPLDARIISKEMRSGLNVTGAQRLRTSTLLDIRVPATQQSGAVLGEVAYGQVEMRGLLKKMMGPFDDGTSYALDEQLGADLKFRFLPDIKMSDDMDLHFLLIQSVKYKIKHHPSPPWRPEYEDEIQEQGLVLVTLPGSDAAFVRIGYFSNIYQANWPSDSPLIFTDTVLEQTVCIH